MREHLSTYRDAAGRCTEEAVVDGTLEDSFPASDPPSFSPQPAPPAPRQIAKKWLLLAGLVLLLAVSAAEVAAHQGHTKTGQLAIPGVSGSAAADERALFSNR